MSAFVLRCLDRLDRIPRRQVGSGRWMIPHDPSMLDVSQVPEYEQLHMFIGHAIEKAGCPSSAAERSEVV